VIGNLLQDVKLGLRTMRKSPGFTAVAVLTLALGIGANTAIFSVINAVLLRPLPYKDDARLVVILHHGENPVSPANFKSWQEQSSAFEAMGAAEDWAPNLTGPESAEKIRAMHISPEVLPMLGVEPLLGRIFLPSEEKEHAAVLSYQLWQTHFAGDGAVIGKTIELNAEKYTVVGVMPQSFKFAPFWATRTQLWAPLDLSNRVMDRNGQSLRVFARLKPGVRLQQAQAEIDNISARLEKEFPGTNEDVRVVALREKVVGNVRPALLVLFGAVAFVLLIACANVGHMLLARMASRQRNIAIHLALGARRVAIMQQLLVESILLALAGGALGTVLAGWGISALSALGQGNIPRFETVSLDSRVLLFALSVSILTGIAFGIVPGWRASGSLSGDVLKEGGRSGTESPGRSRLRNLLVSSEFSFALILVIGAGLMIRTFMAIQHVDPGFSPHHVLSMVIGVAGTAEGTSTHARDFYQQVLQQTAALPGVESVSGINHLPLAGDQWGFPFQVEGRPPARPGSAPVATYRVVFPGYFQTMRIPVLRGRDISQSDNSDSPMVVVINQFMADCYWPGENPVGKRITFGDPQKNSTWMTVVGVVKNSVRDNWIGPAGEELFVPILQSPRFWNNPSSPFAYLTLVIRTAGDPLAAVGQIRRTIHDIDKSVPISEVQTMDQVVEEATGESQFYLLILVSFASLALLLAAIGIYGVMSYSVSLRTREIGIRLALGAERHHVMKMVIRRGIIMAAYGIAAGIAGALLLTRFMSTILYQTTPQDPTTYVIVVFALIATALLASYLPARRATKVDPMEALRYE